MAAPGVGRRLVPWLLAGCFYVALAIILTWPLVAHLSDVLPHDLDDPVLNTWILWWNAHTVPLTARWWNAPAFWPAEGTLALSEHLLGVSVFTTPIQWMGGSPVAAYNVMFLASFFLSALAAHALAFTLTGRHDGAVVAGLVFGFNPYRIAQASHLQVLASYWMPVALLALHQYLRVREGRWLWLFGVAWLLQALSNGYYLLFFPVLLGLWAVWFVSGRTDRRAATAMAGAWLIASAPIAGFLWKYWQVHSAFRLQRAGYEIDRFSADVASLTDTSPLVRFTSGLSVLHKPEGELFPGLTAALLVAVAGCLWLWRAPRAGRSSRLCATFLAFSIVFTGIALSAIMIGPWSIGVAGVKLFSAGTASKPLSLGLLGFIFALAFEPRVVRARATRSPLMFYVMATGAMYLLSFGPRPRFLDAPFMYQAPYAWLMALPGFDSLRVPARFAMLAILCLSTAAGLAFARLTLALGRTKRTVVAALAIVASVMDGWITAMPLRPVPPRLSVLESLPGDTPILEIPLGDTERDTAAMFRSAYHRHPVVNGYSGFLPPHYDVLHLALEAGDQSAIDEVASQNPIVVVADATDREGERWSRQLAERPGAATLGVEAGRRVLRISASGIRHAEPAGQPIKIQSVSANLLPRQAARLIDGDPVSRWSTDAAQTGTETITLDLGAARTVDGLKLSLGPFTTDYPRLLAIDTSEDGSAWTERWKGPTVGLVLFVLLRNVPGAPLPFSWAPTRARFVRLRQLAADPRYYWSVAEVAVFGG